MIAAGLMAAAATAQDDSEATERPDLLTFGMGESQPLVSPDKTETARSLNRRVEISCAQS